MRLDLLCVKLGIAQSRNKAKEFIHKGFIKVNEEICKKASFEVYDAKVELVETCVFVSRAGEKLWNFLLDFSLDFQGKSALDVGSSTGGFTQVLLKKRIKSVVCVDVGSNQLHKSIKKNPKVVFFENTDIRDFKSDEKFDFVLCDVSFIALKNILPCILTFAKDKIILLFKPQFEVGKEVKRNKKGVVQDKEKIKEALQNNLDLLKQNNLKILCVKKSKIKGKEGNEEFFIACARA